MFEVWSFEVAVLEDDDRRTFMARSDDDWTSVNNQVLARLDSMEVRLVFRLNVGTRTWSALTCEADWISALARVRERAATARTRAVSMEVKNLVSNVLSGNSNVLTILQTPRVRGVHAKGNKKRTREDDIPPAVPSNMAGDVANLRDLQDHLACATHSKPGIRRYCWVEVAGEGVQGGHREISHGELTLWAKYIVSKTKKRDRQKLTKRSDAWPSDQGVPAEHKAARLPTDEETQDGAACTGVPHCCERRYHTRRGPCVARDMSHIRLTDSASRVGPHSSPLVPRTRHQLGRVSQCGSQRVHNASPQKRPGEAVGMCKRWEGAVCT
jgi:hypothetical protein